MVWAFIATVATLYFYLFYKTLFRLFRSTPFNCFKVLWFMSSLMIIFTVSAILFDLSELFRFFAFNSGQDTKDAMKNLCISRYCYALSINVLLIGIATLWCKLLSLRIKSLNSDNVPPGNPDQPSGKS